ncbi:hypothetical protein J3Q64DRAFT_1019015 [Phycomyces blakesleeanus]|uniref:Secreted protein n=2 Tax=Phycomyces blakesleeanus TaxID=4837 RepID=A0A167P9B8_PHYB8|nr:hypothetical protein PHYBLDRAFT_60642 [Phycomyces blakesleeanus NRRL 1555(-)]OAD77511.1 hypothetical protein PHYBLDRAFT_60642 [Phycomyces blakesleeanus NRRL 1555(-)]|eukprot:XP_018295551.1 hypothetical protein PHYBLDRAFT_60642 [Phycomyces blakesleeanus NRRL 1555(-)]
MRIPVALIISAFIGATQAFVQSPNYQFNVSLPVSDNPYVAGQTLPLVYDVASNTTSDNLQLSVIVVSANNATNSVVALANANIGQGSSYKKTIGGADVYEHQENYAIPLNTTPGNYLVVYFDNISQTNATVAIVINAPPVSSSAAAPAASSAAGAKGASTGTSATTNSIFSAGTATFKWTPALIILCIAPHLLNF